VEAERCALLPHRAAPRPTEGARQRVGTHDEVHSQ